MNNIEAMKLALEALEEAKLHIWLGDEKGVAANVKCHQTITSLRQAIEQAQQAEPVAWMYDQAKYMPNDLRGQQWHPVMSTSKPYMENGMVRNLIPLYTFPQPHQPCSTCEALARTVMMNQVGRGA